MSTGMILGIVALAYLAYKSGALTQLGIAAPSVVSPVSNPSGLQSNVSLTAPPTVASSNVTSANVSGLAIKGAAGVGTAAVTTSSSFAALGLTGAAAGAAVAGIGAVVAIGAALLAAHEQRKKQATDENSAMNYGVQNYDLAVKQINAAYNARQIDAASAIQLLQQTMGYYWQLVAPHIQPGRNGCNATASGSASCPVATPGKNPCTGNIGAACCVGCYNLLGSADPTKTASGGVEGIAGTILILQHGGGTVLYPEVYGSKYGGQQRNAYSLTWMQAAVS